MTDLENEDDDMDDQQDEDTPAEAGSGAVNCTTGTWNRVSKKRVTTEWRLSGKDGRLHAFQSEAGYMVPREMVSLGFSGLVSPKEVFGPYEAFVAECGHAVPTAMLLQISTGESCVACQAATGALTARRLARDWTAVEPLTVRPGRQTIQAIKAADQESAASAVLRGAGFSVESDFRTPSFETERDGGPISTPRH